MDKKSFITSVFMYTLEKDSYLLYVIVYLRYKMGYRGIVKA